MVGFFLKSLFVSIILFMVSGRVISVSDCLEGLGRVPIFLLVFSVVRASLSCSCIRVLFWRDELWFNLFGVFSVLVRLLFSVFPSGDPL